MSLLDVVRFAATALWRHRLRSALSLLGIAIGVAAVVTLTSLGEGARRYLVAQFEFLGSDLLIVIPGKNETTGAYPGVGGVPNDLTLEDARELERRLSQVRVLAPVAVGNETLRHGDRSRDVMLLGTTHEMQSARDLVVASGQFLPQEDWERGGQGVVLGSKLAEELFVGVQPVGKAVRLGDWRMRVIGVLEPQGAHLGLDMDEIVVLPVSTALRMFNRTSLFRIFLRLKANTDLEATEEQVLSILKERHEEEDVTVLTPDAVADTLGDLVAVLTLVLVGIAAISLTVAGIGVMNVMLVSVAERTSEIGLLRAIGGRRRQILAVFLTESVLISAAGGAAGLLGGLGLVHLARALFPAFPAATPPWAMAAALAVSAVVGVLFGVSPAREATRLDPVTALSRSEQ